MSRRHSDASPNGMTTPCKVRRLATESPTRYGRTALALPANIAAASPAKPTGQTTVDFDAIPNSPFLPKAPDGKYLVRVTFRTCPGSKLSIDLIQGKTSDDAGAPDAHGVAQDSWWAVRCADLPMRTTRLTRGSHSLTALLRRYGFQDGSGCVHHQRATAHFGDRAAACAGTGLSSCVCQSLVDATGVPQFYPRSGVCWYASLCWTSFANPHMRDLVIQHMPADLREACEHCLHSRAHAEHLRKQLWYRYAVGDDVDLPPEMDGRNGFHEFSVLAAHLQIPLLRFREANGKLHPLDGRVVDRKRREVVIRPPRTLDEPHILVLRFQDANHAKFPARRRIVFRGQRYAFLAVYAGARKCGHQIGFACHTGNWRDWSIGDADLHKDGIGPIFIRFDGPGWDDAAWWKAWRTLVHVTKFGAQTREFCSLSWHNPSDASLDDQRLYGRTKASPSQNGTISHDFVYLRHGPANAQLAPPP